MTRKTCLAPGHSTCFPVTSTATMCRRMMRPRPPSTSSSSRRSFRGGPARAENRRRPCLQGRLVAADGQNSVGTLLHDRPCDGGLIDLGVAGHHAFGFQDLLHQFGRHSSAGAARCQATRTPERPDGGIPEQGAVALEDNRERDRNPVGRQGLRGPQARPSQLSRAVAWARRGRLADSPRPLRGPPTRFGSTADPASGPTAYPERAIRTSGRS
jgi:hypothetical protein